MEQIKKVTLRQLLRMKRRSEKIVWVVLYDWPTAMLADQAGIDMILVGDSVAMTMLGLPSTLPITLDVMLHHAQAVIRGVKRAFVVGDMPFMSYVTAEDAIKNAGELLRVGCDAVKLEGGESVAPIVKAVVSAGIPVIGHLGLTPQSVSLLGGYHVQGRTAEAALQIVTDAQALEAAGAFGVLLENIPTEVAKTIAEQTSFLTFSIGGGPDTAGQLLLSHDVLGLTLGLKPVFAKSYANIAEQIKSAFQTYEREVRSGQYPTEEYLSHMRDGEYEKLLKRLNT
ncbi:MAG: 3-methyl-2-oxobutanoate hydroxymethyltransferase [Candidatus Bathyarchaeota archaeon]|nr:3-methyl-2-oxobutanoate hydroxymethyltransferase [Candidatus Bathyarchaeota archaeon]